MSYILQYKSTLENYLKGRSYRILLVDETGYDMICKLFSYEEISRMNITGILKLTDKNLHKAENIFENEIVCFINATSIHYVNKVLEMAITHVYVFFYTYIGENVINTLKSYDINSKLCEYAYFSLNFYPVSEKAVVGEDVFTVLKSRPASIEYHKSAEGLKQTVLNRLQDSLDKCAIREKTENILLYVFGRGYDTISPNVIPWRYQSLINFLGIDVGSCGTDKFFAKYKFSLYNEVIEECTRQSNTLKSQNAKVKELGDKFELNEKTRIIGKHVEISGNIQKLITRKKLLIRSELEQKALIGTACAAELKELEIANPDLYDLLMSGKSATIKGFINILNFLGEDTTRSTYHQYVPPLREMLRGLKNTYGKYDKIYVYIQGFITYEEIAEIALSNETRGPQIYLLSDSTQNSIINPALVSDTFDRTTDCFRIIKKEIKNPKTIAPHVFYPEIESKIYYLKQHHMSFKHDEEAMCESIKSELPIILTREFTKLKAEKPKNKLEKNMLNIKMGKLSKLATEFGKYDKSDRRTAEFVSSFESSFDVFKPNDITNHRQKLLQLQQNEEETQLKDLEEEINRREHGINDICSKVVDVYAQFAEMHELVAKQTLMIGTIEENVINALELMDEGHVELVSAEQHQKDANSLSNKLIAGLFGIVILLGAGVGIKESLTNGR